MHAHQTVEEAESILVVQVDASSSKGKKRSGLAGALLPCAESGQAAGTAPGADGKDMLQRQTDGASASPPRKGSGAAYRGPTLEEAKVTKALPDQQPLALRSTMSESARVEGRNRGEPDHTARLDIPEGDQSTGVCLKQLEVPANSKRSKVQNCVREAAEQNAQVLLGGDTAPMLDKRQATQRRKHAWKKFQESLKDDREEGELRVSPQPARSCTAASAARSELGAEKPHYHHRPARPLKTPHRQRGLSKRLVSTSGERSGVVVQHSCGHRTTAGSCAHKPAREQTWASGAGEAVLSWRRTSRAACVQLLCWR